MMFMIRRIVLAMAVLGLVVGASGPAQAGEIIMNGDFGENDGSLDGWTVVNQTGSLNGNWYVQSGTLSPLSGSTVPAPPEGSYAAMADQIGNGSHVLYQDFVVPTDLSTATLTFRRFIANRANAFFTPDSLDFNVNPNQQARVDITTSTANPFGVASSDVLLNLYRTQPGDPLVSGYTPQANDLTSLLQSHEGQTLRLRFAETDNQGLFQFGVDAVSLSVIGSVIPEPSTLVMAGGAAVMCLGYYWRVRKRAAP